MTALTDSVVEWIKGERGGIRRGLLVSELVTMSAFGDWPSAGSGQWNDAIDDCLDQGRIVDHDGLLRLALRPAAEDGAVEASEQLELF